jgi:hypothetical protein
VCSPGVSISGTPAVETPNRDLLAMWSFDEQFGPRLTVDTAGTLAHVARRRCGQNVLSGTPAAPLVNRATTLADERAHLRLVPRAELAAAIVEEIDQRIAPHAAPPNRVPVARGRLDKFEAFAGDQRDMYRYVTALGSAVLTNIPSHLCTVETEQWLSNGMAMLERLDREWHRAVDGGDLPER